MVEKTTKAPPLTVDTVLTAVQGVNWRTLGKLLLRSEYLRKSHQFIYPKLNEIEQRYQSDGDRLRAVIECWVQGDGMDKKPPWRRIIYALDCANEMRIADNIRHFAEPVLDPILTVEKVAEVIGEVGIREGVWVRLGVPESKLAEVKQQSSPVVEKSRTLTQYWVSTHPDASWERLATNLYATGQERAAVMAKQYLPKDPTLTVEKVAEVMGEVGDGETVWGILGVPESKQQSSRTVAQHWVNTHPGASWEVLVSALYSRGEERAAVMAKQYLPKADPTLTTDNLMEVVKEVEHRWEEFGLKLDMPTSKLVVIGLHQTDRVQMEAVVDYYMKCHPTPSWKDFAAALQRMELHKLADEVTTKYVTARSKELFDEAMKDGYVEARDIKALIFGAAGTGKSHTIALIMDEEPPSVRRSTPCATRPVRAVSRTRAEKRGERWVKITRDELSQTIADTATILPSKLSPSRKSAASSTTSTAPGTSKPQTGDSDSPSSKESTRAPSITHEKVSSVSTAAEEELLLRIKMSLYSHHMKKAFKRDRITLIDTGGQPQFHEVLPIFMQGTSACMFTIKLSESLSAHPLIEYYDNDGKLVGVPYRSAFTNQQILSHCMMVIQAQASQSEEGLCPNAIFIGTHKDLENDCRQESRKEKNLKIREMLLPAVQDDAIYCSEEFKELIFPLNVKNPGPQEKEFAAKLRGLIVERSQVRPKQIPLRWNALELALQKRMLELGRGVLSKAECFAVAQSFHFNEESFEEALKYLHGLNVLFYYKDVLPDIVFCDPMVLLDKITELVEHNHRSPRNSGQLTPTPGKLRKFHTQGIVTLELLSKKEFASHYIPGVFSPEELLKLFIKLLIVSQISEEEYLMPCLLPVADDPALLSPSGSVPPLLLYFPHNALVGVFCALVAYLLSEAKWTLLFNPDLSPVKVDRNTIIFQVPGGLPGRIVLTDSFSTYFQVSLQLPRNAPAALCSIVCPQIRETIMAGLRKASTTLHYSNSVPRDAFLCCEHSTTSPHATVVDRSRTLMTCSRNPGDVCTTLTEQHQVWFGSSGTSDATTSGATTQSSPSVHSPSGSQVITASLPPVSPQAENLDLAKRTRTEYTKPRMAQLMVLKSAKGDRVEIIKTVTPEWKQVGFLMDLDSKGQKIRCIEAEHAHKLNGPVVCCQELFTLWLDSPDATWGNLIELLIDSEHKELAEQVKNALDP